jgi:hypothetical protein
MQNLLEKQLLSLGHDPVFFGPEIRELSQFLEPEEKISGFIDGWINQLKEEGTAYITNRRILFLAFDRLHHPCFESVDWSEIRDIRADIREGISEFAFITPYRSIYITNIESRFQARIFHAVLTDSFFIRHPLSQIDSFRVMSAPDAVSREDLVH